MRVLQGDVWMRRGVSLLWSADALRALSAPQNVQTMRQFFAQSRKWPDELPGNQGRALVVAGLEGCLDLLEPAQAELWLREDFLPAVLRFQDEFDGEAALVFWLPQGKKRVKMNRATEAYSWVCAAPHGSEQLDLGRILWAGAEEDVGRIVDPKQPQGDPDGVAWLGLHHPRLS